MQIIPSDLSVLVVEKNLPFATQLKKQLRQAGIKQLNITKDESAAKNYLLHFTPDICFCGQAAKDQPEAGLHFVQELRALHPFLPLVFFSALPTTETNTQELLHPYLTVARDLSQQQLVYALQLAALQRENALLKKELSRRPSQLSTHGARSTSRHPADLVFFKVGDSYKGIDALDINYFFAQNKFTYAHVQGRNFPTNILLKTLEEQFSPRFVRCHKKYVVNIEKIDTISIKEGKIKIGNELLPLGYAYQKTFLDHLCLIK